MNPLKCIGFVFLFMVGGKPLVWGQLAELQGLQHFNTEAGLPSSESYYIQEGPQGYLWVGTDHGLARFDGKNFRNFGKADGLRSNVFFQMERKGPRLWIRDLAKNVSYLEGDRFHFPAIREQLSQVGMSYQIEDIIPTEGDSTWLTLHFNGQGGRGAWVLLTPDQQVKLFLPENWQSGGLFFKKLSEHQYLTLYLRPQNDFNYNSNFSTLPCQSSQQLAGINKLPSNIQKYRHHCGLSGDFFYLSYNEFLLVFEKGKFREMIRMPGLILDLFDSKEGKIWVSCMKKGLYEIDNGQFEAIPFPPSSLGASVTHIFRDSQQGIWFTTLEKGLFYLPPFPVRQVQMSDRQALPPMFDFFAFDSSLLLMPYTGSPIAVKKNAKGYTLQSLPIPEKVKNAGKDWMPLFHTRFPGYFLFNKVLFEYTKGSLQQRESPLSPPEEKIKWEDCMLQRSAEGLRAISPNRKTLTAKALQFKRRVTCFYYDEGQTLVGTLAGIYSLRTGAIRPWKAAFPFSEDRITQIRKGSQGEYLIATRGNGCFVLREDCYDHYEVEAGLSSNMIRCVLSPNPGLLLCGSHKGLDILQFQAPGQLKEVLHMDRRDGFQSSEVRNLAFHDGYLWALTGESLHYFSLPTPPQANSPLYLKIPPALQAQNQAELPQLAHRFSPLTLHFSCPNLYRASSLEFRYKLRDSDQEWVSLSTNHLTLDGLQSGRYHFEVEAYDPLQKVPLSPRMGFLFEVLPPVYRQAWFLAIAWLLLAGVVFLLWSLRARSLARKRMRELSQINLEQKALRMQMNPHLLFNVLTSVKFFVRKNQSQTAETYLDSFTRYLRRVVQQDPGKMNRLTQEADYLGEYLSLEQLRLEGKFDFEFSFSPWVKERVHNLYLPGMMLQPLVENAIKHGIRPKEGQAHLAIHFEQEEEYLKVVVEDDGIGRKQAGLNKSQTHTSVGIHNIQERLRLFNLKWKIASRLVLEDRFPNQTNPGTRATLYWPLQQSEPLSP